MINEIKTIVKNYLDNAKLCNVITGTVVTDGVKINDKTTVPDDLIKGNLKGFVSSGDYVKLIRYHGGQEFYIVEIIGSSPVIKGMTLSIEPITIGETTISSIKVNEVSN